MKPDEVHDRSRYYTNHCDHGHDTKECHHLRRSLVEELIKVGKLKDFMMRKDKEFVKNNNNKLVLMHVVHM